MNYYEHTCKCGCGGKIEIKEHHKWRGVPLYIHGHNKGNLGNINSDEAKQKMKEAKIGFIPWNKGKPCLEETKQKIIETFVKNGLNKGENNPMYGRYGELSGNWQGGKSFEPYPPEFNKELKDYIKQRDMYMCQTPNCMNTKNLDCHHIDYNKQNNNPENLITLCDSCHGKTHFNRPYWANYYQDILNVYL